MKSWFAADVRVSASYAEAAESALSECGASGTEIDLLGRRSADSVIVTGYFDEEPDADAIREAVENELLIYGISRNEAAGVAIRAVAEQDWLAEWKRHWQPVAAGRFIIAPTWFDQHEADAMVIRIDPGMAFGTGTHDTTKLCLEAIGEHVTNGASFLDVGTGTGILSIAAAKVGAAPIRACDTDSDSVAIAFANCELNGVADQIGISEGSITNDTPAADVVAANLTLDVILPILPLLLKASKKVLILSGILAEQRTSIEAELKSLGADEFSIFGSGEWISVVVFRA
ncbi:MAG: 50S ribosomal protein L11 methyltransferase [Acidobacteria bacterium]|nr:50S ribosomal protein L11 methyltransferase [Acidobacteriota bacterium]